MKKKLLSVLIIATMVLQAPMQTIFAAEIDVKTESVIEGASSTEYVFEEATEDVIAQLKASTNQPRTLIAENRALSSMSSKMAQILDDAGFEHSSSYLNYSMLPMREDPRVELDTSTEASDMWNYSPDFQNVVKSFLLKARANGASDYYATTNMNFTMPGASKVAILANKQLRTQTDLFGAFHGVTVNLGISKVTQPGRDMWHMQVIVRDRYDFKREEYNGLVNIVNNIVYAEQEMNLVRPYDVVVYASRPYLLAPPMGVQPW